MRAHNFFAVFLVLLLTTAMPALCWQEQDNGQGQSTTVQDQNTNPQPDQNTSSQPSNSSAADQENANPLKELARRTKAIDYRQGSTSKVGLTGTSLMPVAHGDAKIEAHSGSTQISASLADLKPANSFGLEYLTYVLWAISPQGRPVNLGEMIPSDDHKASLHASVPMQAFALIVTAEPYYAVTEPSDLVVAENQVGHDTHGWTRTLDVTYRSLPHAEYASQVQPLPQPVYGIDKNVPLSLREARNAVRIAKEANADQYANSAYQTAKQLLDKADDYYNRKQNKDAIATVAREAVQSAEEARVMALRNEQQARIRQQEQEAAQREANLQGLALQQAQAAQQAAAERDAAAQRAAQAEAAAQQAQAAAQTAAEQLAAQPAAASQQPAGTENSQNQSPAETGQVTPEQGQQGEPGNAQGQVTDQAQQQAQAAAQQAQQQAQEAQQQADQARQQAADAQQRAQQQAQAAQQAQQELQQSKQQLQQYQQQLQQYQQQAQQSQAQAQQAQQQTAQVQQQLQQAEADKAATRQRLLGQLNQVLQTKDSARGLIVNMPDVLFATNSADLTPTARERLAKVAGILIAYPDIQIQVNGYTDNTGTAAYNQELSQQRAQSVRTYLVQQGVSPNSVGASGYGENDAIASNSTPQGRQQNRRVELVVSGQSIGAQMTEPASLPQTR